MARSISFVTSESWAGTASEEQIGRHVFAGASPREFRGLSDAFSPRNAIVRVERYGSDSGGEYVYVRGCGTYRPGYPLPLSCIRPLTDQDREDLSVLCQQGFAP